MTSSGAEHKRSSNDTRRVGVTSVRAKRLLTGLLKCGLCGGGMTIHRGDRYYCSARREKGTCNSDCGIAAPELESRVLGGLRDLLLGNQELLDEFAAEFKRELTRLRRQQHGDSRRLSKDLGEVERGIKRCLEFIIGGDGEPGLVRDRLRQLEERRSEIIAETKTRQANQVVEIHPNLPDIYRRKVSNLQEVLEDETARPQAVEIIRSLIDRIEVRPGPPRGRCEVTLVGALAQILGFASRNAAGPTPSGHG